jgi:hypothetical protein
VCVLVARRVAQLLKDEVESADPDVIFKIGLCGDNSVVVARKSSYKVGSSRCALRGKRQGRGRAPAQRCGRARKIGARQ